MAYIKITGTGSILTEGKLEPDKDYLISIRAALTDIKKNVEDKDDPYYTYIAKYISTESVNEIGSSEKIRVVNGKSPSQRLMWAIKGYLSRVGEDASYDNYAREVEKKIEEYDNKGI